jgi:hypothetical protein
MIKERHISLSKFNSGRAASLRIMKMRNVLASVKRENYQTLALVPGERNIETEEDSIFGDNIFKNSPTSNLDELGSLHYFKLDQNDGRLINISPCFYYDPFNSVYLNFLLEQNKPGSLEKLYTYAKRFLKTLEKEFSGTSVIIDFRKRLLLLIKFLSTYFSSTSGSLDEESNIHAKLVKDIIFFNQQIRRSCLIKKHSLRN